MKAAVWIDRVKSVKGWDSDYRAAKELGMTRGGMSQIRTGDSATLSDETIIKVAAALDIDPIVVLADQAMERAKNEAVKSAWSSALDKLGASQLYIM
jgi:transcriptional regulator with XRE-family HTH domain